MTKFKKGDAVRLKKSLTPQEIESIGMTDSPVGVFHIESMKAVPHWKNEEHDTGLTLFTKEGYGLPESCVELAEPEIPAQQKLDQLKKYFESGNDVPVQQATIKAKDFWAIYTS